MENLWPAEVTTAPITTPVSILKEQAALLGKITNNVLEGEVVSETDEASNAPGELEDLLASMTKSPVEMRVSKLSDPVFYHSLNIKVPSLNNYRYRLLYVRHSITLYPASIMVNMGSVACANEIEFKERLRAILSAPETTRILATLISQGDGSGNAVQGNGREA